MKEGHESGEDGKKKELLQEELHIDTIDEALFLFPALTTEEQAVILDSIKSLLSEKELISAPQETVAP